VFLSDDWEGLYIDDQLYDQNHTLGGRTFVDAINYVDGSVYDADTIDLSCISDETLGQMGYELPNSLNELRKYM
jgi:hypothetical protein